jgi:diadenosine tetraphosphate (Ap4A) HIT family hydrolase
MTDAAESCVACDIVAGRIVPPGGTLLRADGLHLHGVFGPTPVAGWVVLTVARHVRCLADLTDDEAASLGRLAARVQRAQRDVLGAETAYAVSLGEVVRHLHLHLIPRYATTPERLRGPRIFQSLPADAIPAAEQERAVARLKTLLS